MVGSFDEARFVDHAYEPSVADADEDAAEAVPGTNPA
jgi:hypothetical protein